ncbi:MAG: lysozyme inhibitor LprI family protein [Campylobacteraceae bacterium]|nr:lysozyme inhibitor LprI family protein [Campylobacteraceae bacterium]
MKKTLLLLTLLSAFLFSASFDCKKATTEVEKLICSNEELSQLDDELNKAYKEILNKTDNKEALIKEQRAWIKERNSCKDEACIKIFYRTQIFKSKTQIAHTSTYAEVLENKKMANMRENIYADVRPADSFLLIGGTEKQICKETLALFNEKGTYKEDEKIVDFDYVFWYLNNSGLISWVPINAASSEMKVSEKIFKFGLEYVELDIDNNGKNEYVYRHGTIRYDTAFGQSVHIFNQKLQDNMELLDRYKKTCEKKKGEYTCKRNYEVILEVLMSGDYQLEWQSTRNFGYDNIILSIISDIKSLKILYPNGYKARENIGVEGEVFWSMFKVKSGVVLVSAVYPEPCGCGNAVPFFPNPEFLVFSLHRDKPANLECIIAPK